MLYQTCNRFRMMKLRNSKEVRAKLTRPTDTPQTPSVLLWSVKSDPRWPLHSCASQLVPASARVPRVT